MTIAATPVPLSEAKARLSELARRAAYDGTVGVAEPSIVLIRFFEPPTIFRRPILEATVDAEIVHPLLPHINRYIAR